MTLDHVISLIAANLICPNVTSPGICVNDCNDDDECDGNLLCCSNGCGRVCTEPVVECAVSFIVKHLQWLIIYITV